MAQLAPPTSEERELLSTRKGSHESITSDLSSISGRKNKGMAIESMTQLYFSLYTNIAN